MKKITVEIPINVAIMLRDAARWFTEDQQRRRKKMPPAEDDHARRMAELAEQFDKMRLEGADILDKAIKGE